MSASNQFLSQEDEQEVVAAIKQAELETSGEIRVHIEGHSDLDHFERAIAVFQELKMDATAKRNGVLIYVAVQDKSFVIYGDQGINELVETNFWDTTKDTIQSHFRAGNFKEGLIAGILKSGEVLKHYFPWEDDDVDELSNDISKS
ncbi:MAG: TPM domain-containing protein [Flavobacteriaceae bacterium]